MKKGPKTMPLADEDRRAIEADCAKLALTSFRLNDSQDYDALAALFTEDAVFIRPTDPTPVTGRDAIASGFKTRPKTRVTRHVCTNLVIDAADADRAHGLLYATLYTADAANAAKLGLKTDGKVLIGEFEDDYRRTAEGWRIARRLGRVILTVE
jgi:ketosteroid isomerase-like protein